AGGFLPASPEALVVAEQPPTGADREPDQRSDRVAGGRQQEKSVATHEEGGADDQAGCGIDEEEHPDHVHAVEVIEVEVEMDRACGGDEQGQGYPGGELDVPRHPQRIRTAPTSGLA